MSKKIKTSDMYYERWNSMIEFVNTVRHRSLSPNWIGKNCGVVMDGAHRSCHGDLLTGTDDIVRPMKFHARPDGCKYSYEETVDYCINGTDMFNDMIGRNKYKIPFSMAVAPRKQKNNIAGQQVNVPRYLNNTPANMLMSRKQDKPKQAINIVFDTDCNWTTPVINRVQCGVNILKAVQALTIAGYDVQLDVMPFCSYSETTSKLYMTTIRLKDYGENVNMNRLAYPIAAVASQFHLGVDWMQRVPDSPYMLAAGWPVYPNEKRYDEIKNYFKNKHDAFFIGLHEMNLLEADKDTDKSVDNLIQYLTGREVERKGGYKTGYAVKQAGGPHIRAYNDEFMDFNENIDDIITETPEFDNPDANNEPSHELTDRQNNNVQDTDSTMDDDMNPSNSESNSQHDDSNESTANNNTEHYDEQSGSDNETDESMNAGSIKQETDESSNAQSDSNNESSNHADEQSGKQIDSNSDNFTASHDTDSTEQRSGNSQNKDSKNEPQSDNGEQNQNDDSNTSSDSEQQGQDSQSDEQDDNIEDSQEQDEPESNDDIDEPEQDMNDEITLDDVLNGDADGAPLRYDYESFIEWLKRVYDWLQKANRK